MGANALRRSRPDSVKRFVKQVAALRGREICLGRLPVLRGQARRGEGLEGTLRLRGQYFGSARNLAWREGNPAAILELYGQRFRGGWRCQFWRQFLRFSGNCGDQPRRTNFAALVLLCKTETDFGR